MKLIYFLISFISIQAFAQLELPRALVYGGVGACEDGCVAGAVEAASVAGLNPIVVDPNTFDPEMLKDAVIWIQPGGKAKGAAKAMGSAMMSHVREFVRNGGGYVGFCAGAFLATSKIGTSLWRGLGITPGKTILYRANKTYPSIENTNMVTNKGIQNRQIYWEGGPYFNLSGTQAVEIRGRYARTNQVSSVRNSFGKGRVAVSGDHPESPEWWRTSSNLIDNDGLDYDITTEMIHWAIGKN